MANKRIVNIDTELEQMLFEYFEARLKHVEYLLHTTQDKYLREALSAFYSETSNLQLLFKRLLRIK